MCRKQKTLGAILIAAGAGILLGLVIGSGAAEFLIATGLIFGGVFLLIR